MELPGQIEVNVDGPGYALFHFWPMTTEYSQPIFNAVFVLDLLLLVAGDLLVVLGHSHLLELVKSQKA